MRSGRRVAWCVVAGALGAGAMLGGEETAAQATGFQIRIVDANGTGGGVLGGVDLAYGPAWSGDGDRIAFAGVRSAAVEDEGAQIFTAAPDGSGLAQVTHLPEGDVATLAWSPEGDRIAFASGDPSETRLGVVNADGTGLRTLAGSLNEDFPNPSWSPDGTRLAFVRGESDRSRLSVVDADGTGLRTLRRISLDHDEGGLPRWSPDGRRIAYVDVGTGGRFHVFTIRPDGHGRRRVGNTSCALDPTWRPDGRRLACVGLVRSSAGAPRFAINIVGLGGRIRRSLPPGGSRAALRAPTWSPDATKLTYLRMRFDGATLRLIDADGRHDRRLSARPRDIMGGPATWSPTWSPDSSRIAFGTSPRSG